MSEANDFTAQPKWQASTLIHFTPYVDLGVPLCLQLVFKIKVPLNFVTIARWTRNDNDPLANKVLEGGTVDKLAKDKN